MSTSRFEQFVWNNWGAWRPYDDVTSSLATMALGLSGEAGESADHIKKIIRDYGSAIEIYPEEKRQQLLLELGDVLHYLTRIALEFGWTLEEVMAHNISKLEARNETLLKKKAV